MNIFINYNVNFEILEIRKNHKNKVRSLKNIHNKYIYVIKL